MKRLVKSTMSVAYLVGLTGYLPSMPTIPAFATFA
jgi:hypothetical protein